MTQWDDLGRVVIPKEIRRTLRIREGDPLEIFTDREGEVILKKYSPVGEMGKIAEICAESLAQTLNCTACIADGDQIVAAAGNGKRDLQDKYITEEINELLQQRKSYFSKKNSGKMVLLTEGAEIYKDEIVCPIISEGDVIGGVILLGKESSDKFGDTEQKVAENAADFLGRQMEQ